MSKPIFQYFSPQPAFVLCLLCGLMCSLSAHTQPSDSLRIVIEKNPNSRQRAFLKQGLSLALFKEHKFGQAAQASRESLAFFNGNVSETIPIAEAMKSLAEALDEMGLHQSAADTALLAAALFDKEKIWHKKAACLFNTGRSYMILQQNEASAKYFDLAMQYRQELQEKQPETLVLLLTNMGTLAKQQHNPDKALSLLLEAEKESRLSNVIFPFLYIQLRMSYIKSGEFAEALYWNKKAIETDRQRHDNGSLCQYLAYLGELYVEINDDSAAVEVLEEAIKIAESIGNKYALMEARLSLSDLYVRRQNLEGMQSILADLEKSMTPSILNHISEFSYLKGAVYALQGEVDSSIWWHDQAIKIARKNDYQTELCMALTKQGGNYITLQQYGKALKLYKEALILAKKDNYRTAEMTIWSQLATAYEKTGNFKLALQAQRSADTLAVSILQQREKTYYNLAYLNLQTRSEKNTLEQENLLYAKEQESLRLKIGWLTTSLVALLLCTGVYFFYRQLQKQRKYATVLKKESDQKIDTLKTINAALSHDLKNPALKAKYYLSRLKEKLQPAQYQLIKPDYALIESNIDHFYLLINKLRSLYNFENTEVSATTFEADSVLADIKLELSPFIEKTNAQITQDALPPIETDKLLFRQMMMNLLHNAVKFASLGQHPLIHIGYESRDGKHIFKVRDNGIGVPKEEQENIFKLFRSAHQRVQVEGDGIGLAISKRIVEKLGGNIRVDSVPNGGAQFMVSIPAA